jgi:hypothetical protein
VTIVGETGYIRTSRPCQCPEGFTIVTRQGDEPDPMLLRGKAVTPLGLGSGSGIGSGLALSLSDTAPLARPYAAARQGGDYP